MPNLAERRGQIARAFAAALEVAPFDPAPPFEFSLGRPLAGHSLSQTALALLRWPSEPLPLTTIRALLLAPECGGRDIPGLEHAALAAAEFDAFDLAEHPSLRPELTLTAAIALLERSRRRARLANLLFRLRNLRDAATEIPRAPSTWTALTEACRALLDAAGLNAASFIPADESSVWRAWESLLDEIATLDATAPPPASGLDAVLAELSRLAASRIVAPANREAPIQILGPLELSATQLDALWFLGADDLTWPPGANPNPLLPWRLQASLAIPGADRTRHRATYAHLTARLAASATEVVFSYAALAEDGERRSSPLLTGLHLTPMRPAAIPTAPPAPVRTFIADDSTLPPPNPADGLRGGARVLELQAACGFRAFAELRVFSTSIDTRELGLDAMARGSLVHATMELFWKTVIDQQALRTLTPDARHATLDRCILDALTASHDTAETPWDRAYLETQRQRLHDLLRPWLAVELERPPFSVYQQETNLEHAEIGGLRLHKLRADRIDETEGGLLLLDYKTGPANPAQWLSDRPEKPQLPLYAAIFNAAAEQSAAASPLFRQEPLTGIAFVQLRAGRDLAMRGFSDDPRVLTNPARMDTVDFPEQVAEWRRILATLAQAFAAGDARVAPRTYPETCKHCGQRILCRLDPTTLTQFDDEDDPAERSAHDA